MEDKTLYTISHNKFIYDFNSGKLLCKVATHYKHMVGAEVGTTDTYGYRIVKICGKAYKVHRIIWLMVYGEFPKQVIDHKDMNPSNNRIENLRDVSQSVNVENTIKYRLNKHGYKGVKKVKNKYVAQVVFQQTHYYSKKSYNTPKKAHKKYLKMKDKLWKQK